MFGSGWKNKSCTETDFELSSFGGIAQWETYKPMQLLNKRYYVLHFNKYYKHTNMVNIHRRNYKFPLGD